jgi:hypothetical protein
LTPLTKTDLIKLIDKIKGNWKSIYFLINTLPLAPQKL